MMVTASHMNKCPAIGFEFCEDVTAVHSSIIHTIHTSSMFNFWRKPASRFALVDSVGGRGWRLGATWEQEKLEARKMLENRAENQKLEF